MLKEETICKFQQGKDKLHLIKLTDTLIVPDMDYSDTVIHYQIRLNRKRIKTSKFEYEVRKLFATMAQNIVLQLKIY